MKEVTPLLINLNDSLGNTEGPITMTKLCKVRRVGGT